MSQKDVQCDVDLWRLPSQHSEKLSQLNFFSDKFKRVSSSGMSCFMYRLSLSDSKKPPKQLLKRLHVPRFAFLLFCQRERKLFFLVSFRHLQSRPLGYQLTQEIAFPFLSENVHFFAFRTFSQRYLHQVAIYTFLGKKKDRFVTVVCVED